MGIKLYQGGPRRWGRLIFLSHLSPPLPAQLSPNLRHPHVAKHSCFSLSAAPTAECLKISFPHFYFSFCPGGDSTLSPCVRRLGISSLSPTQEWDTAGTRPCPCTGTLFNSCWGDTKVTFQEVTTWYQMLANLQIKMKPEPSGFRASTGWDMADNRTTSSRSIFPVFFLLDKVTRYKFNWNRSGKSHPQ